MAMAMAMSGEYMACAALAMESTITTPAFSIPCRASFLASKRVAIQEHAVFPNHRSIIYPCSNLQHPFRRGPYSAASFAASFPTPFEEVEVDRESVPKPIVVIDQDSDPHATVVELGFGDRLGALLDTVGALKELGLNVVKGTVSSSSLAPNKFSITRADTGRKVENPELLETIRLTIINNLLQYHPESSEQLAMGEAFGIKPPKEKLDVNVATHITIKRDGPKRSLLTIKTADRPGLLMEIVKVISDTSVAVESGEVETEGLVAKDKLHVSYQGAALSKSMEEVLTNCLRYYLRRPETDVDSY